MTLHMSGQQVVKLDIIWVFRQHYVANKSILQTNAKETFLECSIFGISVDLCNELPFSQIKHKK